MNEKQKLIAIIGPTAVGKSSCGIEMAIRFNGEIISADSRQVYRGLDIGTGKVTDEEMRGVPHHALDIRDPDDQLTVAEYKDHAQGVISDIYTRGKVSFIVGGTGLYVQAVVDDLVFPEVPPDAELRGALEAKDEADLYNALKKLDPNRAETIDQHNKHRLVRALEIIRALGSVPALERHEPYNTLLIGLDLPKRELRGKIRTRLHERMERGMIKEVESLIARGITHERLETLGLEYRYVSRLLRGELTREKCESELFTKIVQFSKRQRTWFKRDERIQWYSPRDIEQITRSIEDFLTT